MKSMLSDRDQVSSKSSMVATKQIFIIGSRRSGTTWTLWLLANHPSIVGVLQTNLVESFKEVEKWWMDDQDFRNSIISASREKSSKKTLKDFLSDEEFYTFCRELTSKVLSRAFNEKPDATVIVESQPENIGNLDYLRKLYPDAYFLHVIRDPRSVFSSWKSVSSTWSSPDVFQDKPTTFSERWRKEVLNGRKHGSDASRYREVRYEELHDNGVRVLQDIYTWLGLESNIELATNSVEACKMSKLRDKANMPKGFFRKGLNEAWKAELSETDVKCLEYLLADVMDDLGYERVNKGEISLPFKLWLFNIKRGGINWIKSSFVFRLLRKIKHRMLG